MKEFKTEQETFWSGEFGNEYIKRNQGAELLASNISFFADALRGADELNSCIEFGANIGMNLKALRQLYPKMSIQGIEINTTAANELAAFLGEKNVFRESIIEPTSTLAEKWDLVLIKGVLIHINPDELTGVYAKLVNSTRRYLLVAEYYNPTPMTVPYRGHSNKLFKRDFAGEILDKFPEMKLIDYGFKYHRDRYFPQDDVTWFLLEKHN